MFKYKSVYLTFYFDTKYILIMHKMKKFKISVGCVKDSNFSLYYPNSEINFKRQQIINSVGILTKSQGSHYFKSHDSKISKIIS